MENKQLQPTLLNKIKALLPPHRTLVAAISETLDIGQDAAYRRIRLDTPLSLTEAEKLCREFGISLDQFLNRGQEAIVFHSAPPLGQQGIQLQFASFVEKMEKSLGRKSTEPYFLSMEFPIYHLLQVPELARFKFSYWQTLLDDTQGDHKFSLAEPVSEVQGLSHLLELTMQTSSTEIVSEQAWDATLKQILFFLESGRFAQREDALLLLRRLEELTDHLRHQATLGQKFAFGTAAPEATAPVWKFELFYNEMIFAQTMIYLKQAERDEVFLEHNLMGYISTTSPEFCSHSWGTFVQIMKKSIPISNFAERERQKFFRTLQARIAVARAKVQALL